MRRLKALEKYLSLIIPAWNEEACIYRNALAASEKIAAFCSDFEVLVVDDGSDDRTQEEALRAAAEDPRIRLIAENGHGGKGRALCVGAHFAKGHYIAFCDADMDLDPSDLEHFLRVMKEERAGAVIASKLHPASHVDAPLLRRVYSRGYAALMKVLLGLPVRDTQTGLKLFRGDVMKKVCAQIRVTGFAFDAEMLCLIHAHGLKIVSMPVNVTFSRGGAGRVGIRDAADMFRSTLGIFARLRLTGYYRKHPVNADNAEAFRRASEIVPS